MNQLNHKSIEPKWQKIWEKRKAYQVSEDFTKPKKYILNMFPYPSAAGLHVGHPLSYTATDILSRYYTMNGYNVLHPTGYDAFGLPAEQHAIATGEHPAKVTENCIDNFRRQLKSLGLSYDWDREISTCAPGYYKWTQWIFKILLDKGLAYQDEIHVNWCPELKTVLANDEVQPDGTSERGGHPVFRVKMKQWMLKITAYAERLLDGLNDVDWPESTKEIQRNWIGRSEGAKVQFPLDGFKEKIEIFTTRVDTLMGVSYMVLAPEHPLVEKITTDPQRQAVTAYQQEVLNKSDMARGELNKDKTGVFTGSYALNPLNGEKVPVWIGDYVLMSYGTGAVMAVPGHDTRDNAFAQKYNLSIPQVIAPKGGQVDVTQEAYTGEGVLCHSGEFDGLEPKIAQRKIVAALQEKGLGEVSINYKLRDWLFSRQRYWGEPFPILKDTEGKVVRALRDDELPLTLPEVDSYEPTDDGSSPLGGIKEWLEINEGGKTLIRETDTMPGAAGSSWYFLRYCDPHNPDKAFDYEKAKYWMPVDVYVGGQEHAVGHLLYSRFWTKVLYDAGISPVDEPFNNLIHQGMITKDHAKMSKSKGNGVSPDDIINRFGADSLRTYEMFMGPLTQTKEWDEGNLGGVHKFLQRITRHILDEDGNSKVNQEKPSEADLKALHKCIKKVSSDIENLSFNTAVSELMKLYNQLSSTQCTSEEVVRPLIQMLGVFAPHLGEELWQKVVNNGKLEQDDDYPFLCHTAWPKYEEALTIDSSVKMGVQVNGKHRGEIEIPREADQETAMSAATSHESIQKHIVGKEVHKVIYVPGRILNIIAK